MRWKKNSDFSATEGSGKIVFACFHPDCLHSQSLPSSKGCGGDILWIPEIMNGRKSYSMCFSNRYSSFVYILDTQETNNNKTLQMTHKLLKTQESFISRISHLVFLTSSLSSLQPWGSGLWPRAPCPHS